MESQRIGVLDGLRGIAIAMVVWFHVWQQSWFGLDFHLGDIEVNLQPFAEAGFLGVNLFFFISGLVIAEPFILAWAQGRERPSLQNFYWRRFLKIVPSYWLSIAVALLIGSAVYSSTSQFAGDMTAHALFVHNWWINTKGSLNGALWTLGVEWQFYLIAPFFIALFLRMPLAVTLVSIAGCIIWRYSSYDTDINMMGFKMDQLPGQFDFFMMGILVAYLFVMIPRWRPALAARRGVWTWAAVGGAAAFVWLVNDCYAQRFGANAFNVWQMHNRTYLAVACGLLALGSLFAADWWKAALANRVLLFLAAISFNLYLWHDLIALASVRFRFPNWSTQSRFDDRAWASTYFFAIILASVAVSTIVTYGFERPILRYKHEDPHELWRRLLRRERPADASQLNR